MTKVSLLKINGNRGCRTDPVPSKYLTCILNIYILGKQWKNNKTKCMNKPNILVSLRKDLLLNNCCLGEHS